VPVAHAFNLNYSGTEIGEITVQSQPWQIVLRELILKTLHKNKSGGVAQSEDHEFKPQYLKKTKPNQNKTKLNCPTLLGRSRPNRVTNEGQKSCCLVKTATTLTTLHKLADLTHFPIATNPVDRRNQILITSKPPGKTTSEFLVPQYQDWMPKE
jgi:hypothetical protein